MIMTVTVQYTWILFVLLLAFFISPVSGAITTILPGDSVFIGEQGLDVTLAMEGDTQIGWWASAASIAGSSPSQVIQISNPTSYSISPSVFGSYNGAWYHLTPSGIANGTVFTVMDPQIVLKIEDTTVNVDVSNAWVPTDDEIRFRIETNLVSIAQRSGVVSVPVTIKVQDPNGGTLTALINRDGTATSIVDYPVTTTPQYTDSIWDTGKRSTYPPGTYTIWAECNVNSMKDNYNQVGKTVSPKVSLQNQDHNPLITGNYPSTTIKTQVTTAVSTITTTPAPVTETLTVVETTFTTISTPKPVMQTETQFSVTTAPTPSPTYSPGFEGILAGIATLIALIVCFRKD
jgi:hypothetical protein